MWHFGKRSGAPSRPPVRLHNVAACQMETGITNLCLSPVARRAPPAPPPPPSPCSFFVLPFHLSRCIFVVCVVGGWGGFILFVNTEQIITVGNKEGGKHTQKKISHTHTDIRTFRRPRGVLRAGGVERGWGGGACQHQL